MYAKKICMLGAFSVGKTSLVKSFVHSIFSEKYHTTIGVKIDKKVVQLNEELLKLIIWDIEGVDAFTELNTSFLRGASGVVVVIDGTRSNTLDTAREIITTVRAELKHVDIIVLMNKSDIRNQWAIKDINFEELPVNKSDIFFTSAKTGENVEMAFQHLAELLLASDTVE